MMSLTVAKKLCGKLGITWVNKGLRLIGSLIFSRIRLSRAIKNKPFDHAANESVEMDERQQQVLDACWALGHGIGPVNPPQKCFVKCLALALGFDQW